MSGRIARASGSFRRRADEVRPADDQPGLRPADQLVAGEQRRGRRRRPGARSASARGPGRRPPCRGGRPLPRSSTTSAPCAWARAASSAGIGRLREAGHREVGRVDAQDHRRATLAERCLVVLDAGPVRRPDFDEAGAGPPDDLRDPDAAADLDELAPPDDDALPAGQADGEDQGGGAVVRDQGVLGAGEGDEVLLGRAVAAPPPSGGAVELEKERARGRPPRRRGWRLRPGRPPQVRVDDHAGGVDDAGRKRARGDAVEPGDDRVRRARRSSAAARRPPAAPARRRPPRAATARSASCSPLPGARAHGDEEPLDAGRTRTAGRLTPG